MGKAHKNQVTRKSIALSRTYRNHVGKTKALSSSQPHSNGEIALQRIQLTRATEEESTGLSLAKRGGGGALKEYKGNLSLPKRMANGGLQWMEQSGVKEKKGR